MASNVNVKFVVILTSSLLILATLVGGAAYMALTKSAEEHIADGDRYVSAGDYEEAAKSYSKAVNDNPTNVQWLKKWQDALVNTIPETDLEYSQGYSEHYLDILRRLASIQETDPEPQRALLDAIYQQYRLGGAGADVWASFYNTCESAYENLDLSTPEAQRLLRYRGFARVAMMPLVETTTEEHDQAVEDLEAAFAADPTDIEAMTQLVSLYHNDWVRSLAENRPDATATALENYKGAIDKMRELFPDDPRFLASELDFLIESKIRLDPTVTGRAKIRKELAGIEKPLVEVFLNCDTDLLDAELITNTFGYGRSVWNVRPDDYNDLGLQVTERVLKARPDDFDVRFFRGTQLIIANRNTEAQEVFQQLVDTPDLPISLDGLRLKNTRINALFQLANTSLAIWDSLPIGEEKNAALMQAHAYGDELNDKLGEDSSMALMINGRVAMAEQRNQDAVSILQRLNTLSNGANVSVVRLLASALTAQGTLGAALDQYDKWIELENTNVVPLLESAQIEIQLRNPDGAIARLRQALQILPDNAQIQQQLNTLLVSTGAVDNLEATDPVVAVMMHAEALAKQGEQSLPEAIKLLEDVSAENPEDARPLTMQIEYMIRVGDTDGAMAIAKKGQSLLPGEETFNRYVAMLKSGDRTQIAEEYIDQGPEPEPVKLVKKYAMNLRMGDKERAQSFLDDAEARFPKNPTVLDALFVKAMQDDDTAKAREVAATAAETNADQCDGLLYQARIDIKEKAYSTAQNNLQIAVEKAPFSPQAWRLYGQVLLRTGRIEEAVDSLAKAYEYKPDDLDIAKAYARTLIQLRRLDEALVVVRAARRFTTTDKTLNDIWLALESETGDIDTAITYRKALYDADPENLLNTRTLISLLTNQERFDEAGELIQASIKSEQTDLGLAVIQARWYAQQGDIDEGQRLIRAFIDSLDPSELNENPYLALGNYLISNGRTDAGIEAFREGAKHQAPDTMAADRRLGDYFFSRGQYEDSLASYRKVTDAGADSTGLVSKRIIETLLRLDRWDEAEAELDTLAASSDDDVQTVLLRADVAVGREDLRLAHDLVNKAVEMAPNKPEPFIRRAQLDINSKDRLSFVLSDLEQAIRLQPTAIQPRQMRANVLIQNNRSAEAIAELRRGIDAISNSNALRQMLIQELWQTGRHGEAHAEARRAIEANDQNPVWLMVAGDLASRDPDLKNNWAAARGYFESAYKLDRTRSLALRLANADLFQTPPDADAAIKVIEAQGADAETNSQLLILRARAAEVKGDHDEALALAERSLAAATNAAELRHWFLHVESNFADQSEMISFIDRMQPPEDLAPAYVVHAASFLAIDPTRRSSVMQGLRNSEAVVKQMAEQDKNYATLASLYRVLGQLEYGQGQYEAAADSFAKGVEIMPNDMEFNNNLAYTRAKYLNDLEGALAPAEKAVVLSPANSPALDTLGWIYYRLGRLGQAKQKITRAMTNASNPIEQGGAYLHMAQILLAEGNRPEARKYADLADEIIKQYPALGPEFNTDLNALMTDLQDAENTG